MLNDNKETKICKKCGRELPLDRYQLYKSTGYRRIICKDCWNKDMRENRLQKRITTGLEQYSKEKSMKIQRRFKKPYLFQKLDKTESGIKNIARDEVFVRLLDYKSAWVSNYGRVIQKLEDGTYQLAKGVYTRATKELTYTVKCRVLPIKTRRTK